MSVTPSRALATKVFGVGNLPTTSAVSSLQISLPSAQRRKSVTGGASTRDQVSTTYFRSGENWAVCVPSPLVSIVRPVPSKFTRQNRSEEHTSELQSLRH